MQANRRFYDVMARILGSALWLIAAGCVSAVPPLQKEIPPTSRVTVDADDEMSELMATMSGDLALVLQRPEIPRKLAAATVTRPTELPRMSIRTNVWHLPIPVVGVTPDQLEDNFGDPRDGGRRTHRGLDIFAHRGTEVVAVADGTITYIGEQPKAGRCVWLTTADGLAFFYAHFDRWAPGLYEGMTVRPGDLLGYVGNTGNARHTASHLHFTVIRNDDAVDPYPLLRSGSVTLTANRKEPLRGGFSSGGGQ